MSNSSGTPDSEKNIAHHGGVVHIGTFYGAIATSTGSGTATNVTAGPADQVITTLRNELSKARRLLQGNHDPALAADREDAIEEINALDGDLASGQEGQDKGKLRRRLKALVGTLNPVAEIIGGTAAFLEIINDLKSLI